MTDPDFLALLGPNNSQGINERHFSRGQHLFFRGEAPRAMFYIVSGEARLLRASASGTEMIFQRVHKGFLAEASLDQSAYHCDGVANAETKAIAMPIEHFRAAMVGEAFRNFWLRHLGLELRKVRAQTERLTLRGASDRILHYLETEGTDGAIILSQSRKSWAAELGLTHEALYRTLNRLMTNGVIGVHGCRISLTSRSPQTSHVNYDGA